MQYLLKRVFVLIKLNAQNFSFSPFALHNNLQFSQINSNAFHITKTHFKTWLRTSPCCKFPRLWDLLLSILSLHVDSCKNHRCVVVFIKHFWSQGPNHDRLQCSDNINATPTQVSSCIHPDMQGIIITRPNQLF